MQREQQSNCPEIGTFLAYFKNFKETKMAKDKPEKVKRDKVKGRSL